jgi:hypothetical protein
MITTNRESFDTVQDPISTQFYVNKKDDISKRFIGKRVGNVIIVPVAIMSQKINFKKELEKIKNDERFKEVFKDKDISSKLNSFDYNRMLIESPFLYRMKIIEIVK